ncbi:MAG TPA: hypothetical protein VMN03_07120, partial [Burkholderiales bacterium]|nr:hypothetical protein [Burkholderiales bacterium]
MFLLLPILGGAGGQVVTVAGTGAAENNGSAGSAREINIGQPFGVEFGPDGALYITEVQNHRVLRWDPQSDRVTTVAGNGTKGYSGDGGPATAAQLNEPYEVRFDPDGHMFFVEMKNHIVRRMDARSQTITTVAGNGQQGYGGDGGPATQASLNNPHSIALDGQGKLYIADIGNHRIRRVDLQRGTIETIAGTGERKLPQSGQMARGHAMLGPRALFIADETLWIALREGHSVWKMPLRSGVLTHIAGSGERGFSGDGGMAASAKFDGPKGIALDVHGHDYVADTENQVIRRIDAGASTISTAAGSGPRAAGGGGDG